MHLWTQGTFSYFLVFWDRLKVNENVAILWSPSSEIFDNVSSAFFVSFRVEVSSRVLDLLGLQSLSDKYNRHQKNE